MPFNSRNSFLASLLGLGFCISAQANNISPEQINDGPYIQAADNNMQVRCVLQGNLVTQLYSKSDLPLTVSDCNYPAKLTSKPALEQKVLEYTTTEKIVAVSDFHGQYDLMHRLLVNNGIIDTASNWTFGKGHFVITGDIFDRGDKVTEILWFLHKLEQQAEEAGGKLHLLLGNHEVMVMNGDLRYLHPKYVEVQQILGETLDKLLTQKTILGAWLRSKPVLVKINNNLFAHGGFHPDLAREKMSLESINRIFKENLVKFELNKPRSEWGNYLHRTNGPIWYRGYFKDNGATSQEIDLLLKHFEVDHLIVGHTSQKQVLTKHQGRVIAIDSSIKRGAYGELLIIENNTKWRATLNGEKIKLD